MEYKKSAVDLTDLAIAVLVLGILVTIGADILLNISDNRLTSTTTIEVANESLITVTEAGETLARDDVSGVSRCINASGAEEINSANYTLSTSGTGRLGTISTTTGSQFNNTDMNCTYNVYNDTQTDVTLAEDAAIGLGEYGNWFDIIVIVGVAAVILALIFMAFGRRGSQASY